MERPALKRLLAAIEAKRVNCVVVYKVDPFGGGHRSSHFDPNRSQDQGPSAGWSCASD